MGSGTSREPTSGVPANPRLIYTDKLAKQEAKNVLMDTPVLIDVQHGSVRYRYSQYSGEPSNKLKRIERPYEGSEKDAKTNYFYHSRLKAYGTDADKDQEDRFKFLHVVQAPKNSNQKKLYYVYGRGWDSHDGERVKPTHTKEEAKDFSWPGVRVPNDLYYNLQFTGNAGTGLLEASEDPIGGDAMPNTSNISFSLDDTDKVVNVKAKLAVMLIKAASNIHVCLNKQELRNEDRIIDLREDEEVKPATFIVNMRLI